MIARESSNSVVLVDQEGKQAEILRSQIDEMRTAGKSLMPEGLERDLSRQELADVIAYVRAARSEPKPFPGNRPTVVQVDENGSVPLLAKHARLYGPTIVFDQERSSVRNWRSPDDHLRWSLGGLPAGVYQVEIEYACDDQAEGDTFLFHIAGQTIGARVSSTGGWDNYGTMSVGLVTLAAGRAEVSMSSEGLIGSALLDLRAVRLRSSMDDTP